MKSARAIAATVLLLSIVVSAREIPPDEYAARRAKALARLADGLLLIHARSLAKAEDQPAFLQDSTFLYFTGLINQPGAVLVLDGPRKQARLYVPPAPRSFGSTVEGVGLEPSVSAAREIGVHSVERWDALFPYLKQRLGDGVARLYVDESRHAESPGVPEPFWRIAGERALWRSALAHALPEARIESAKQVIQELKWVKSAAEIEALRETARTTTRALLAGIRSLQPGRTQRQAESAVVAACLENGAEGPSFWPWLMSGPNAHVPRLLGSFFDYHHHNRTMEPGELVRVDIGCTAGSYGADVGRTAPVSGKFTDAQREIWNLLVDAYRVGLAAMRPGVTFDAVMQASRDEIERRRRSLQTDAGRKAGAMLVGKDGFAHWSIHGVGIDSAETPPHPRLDAGSVIAFEPIFSAGADAYYLEDMIAITADGAEVLSDGLPYTADEIEKAMAARPR
jgi:Xaa-Pro aminopeptidase